MGWTTHEVANQVPDLIGYNLYDTDAALREAVRREGAGACDNDLSRYGARLGAEDVMALARRANRNRPELEAFDRCGRRVDRVRFDPAWHQLMAYAFEHGMHIGAWPDGRAGWSVARAAYYLLHGQVEAGTLCPTTMTAAAAPALRGEPWFDALAPHLYSLRYDARDLPLPSKDGMTIGMGMTEKQGGSDLRANTTRAFPVGGGGRGAVFRLIGHKWFFSAPTADAHLVLARHDDSLSCFYVPRWTPDGTLNAVRIQRLKDKMGNTSNASAEVEFQDAHAVLVGSPGRGIAILADMAMRTRHDCVLGSAALLRQAVVQALHYARHRQTFGKALIDHGLMRQVLADLVLESEAATALALRLAGALDAGTSSPLEHAWVRIMTPAAKFWVCKRTEQVVAECMEVWGGNGYIEDGPMPRLYREAPVNSIWEGSGNIMCLDVLRALRRDPSVGRAFVDTLVHEASGDTRLRDRAHRLEGLLAGAEIEHEPRARHIVREVVLLTQAVLLLRHAPRFVADAFVQARIVAAGDVFGGGVAIDAAPEILARAWPL